MNQNFLSDDHVNAPVVLVTFNARYIHASLSLRTLVANWQGNRPLQTYESTIDDHPVTAAQKILAMNPVLAAFSVYIWNAELIEKTVRILRRVAPHLLLIAGGPEMVMDETSPQWFYELDAVVEGEADIAFTDICMQLLNNIPLPEQRPRVFRPPLPSLEDLQMPSHTFTDEDIAHRMVSVETSRGCPMHCAFCTAAYTPLRHFPTAHVLEHLHTLYEQGVRFFKFLDRSLHLTDYEPLLDWLLARPDTLAHFELTPHRLAPSLANRLRAFGPGRVQVEVGVQTLHPDTANAIARPISKYLQDMLLFFKKETHVHVHADLIAGLPGETLSSLAYAFDTLLSWGVDEIQLGVLKRLRGTSLCHQMPVSNFEPFPPYTVLFTDTLSFHEIYRIRRMAQYWNIVYNSGNFLLTLKPLVHTPGAFFRFLEFSDWLHQKEGKTRAIELNRMAKLIYEYFLEINLCSKDELLATLEADYVRCQHTTRPDFLQKNRLIKPKTSSRKNPFARQHRHRPPIPNKTENPQ